MRGVARGRLARRRPAAATGIRTRPEGTHEAQVGFLLLSLTSCCPGSTFLPIDSPGPNSKSAVPAVTCQLVLGQISAPGCTSPACTDQSRRVPSEQAAAVPRPYSARVKQSIASATVAGHGASTPLARSLVFLDRALLPSSVPSAFKLAPSKARIPKPGPPGALLRP